MFRIHIYLNFLKFLKAFFIFYERSKLKSKKQIEILHKPIGNLKELLEYIKSYNKNLNNRLKKKKMPSIKELFSYCKDFFRLYLDWKGYLDFQLLVY